jgi:tRNA 2-thiouridine synthesizing protein A
MADRVLDLKGLRCPLPVMRAKKALREMPVGATLEVLANDPVAPSDFEALCQVDGHTMLEMGQVDPCSDGDVWRFLLRKGP